MQYLNNLEFIIIMANFVLVDFYKNNNNIVFTISLLIRRCFFPVQNFGGFESTLLNKDCVENIKVCKFRLWNSLIGVVFCEYNLYKMFSKQPYQVITKESAWEPCRVMLTSGYSNQAVSAFSLKFRIKAHDKLIMISVISTYEHHG